MATDVPTVLPMTRVGMGRYIEIRRIVAGIIDLICLSYIQKWADDTFGYIPDAKSTPAVLSGGGWGYMAYPVPVVDSIWLLTIVVLYFFVQEALFSTTIGKTLLGLCVVDIHGKRITPAAALIRNTVRLVDAYPSWYIVGLIAARMSPNYQRLGDRAARTYVIAVAHRPRANSTLTFFWGRIALVGMLIVTMMVMGWRFTYTRQPELVIHDWRIMNDGWLSNSVQPVTSCGKVERFFGDYALNAPIEQYWLENPHWGNGTVTYSMLYQLHGQEKTCTVTITLRQQSLLPGRWQVVNVRTP